MADVTVREMTAAEYDDYLEQVAVSFAESQVEAGTWTAGEALAKARAGNAEFLPRGFATPGMVFLVGERDGTAIGRMWIAMEHPRGVPDCAFLLDIDVLPEHRGQGLGRALLAAGEAVVRERGVGALELNVFGANTPAVRLYESSGFQVKTQQMRKNLR